MAEKKRLSNVADHDAKPAKKAKLAACEPLETADDASDATAGSSKAAAGEKAQATSEGIFSLAEVLAEKPVSCYCWADYSAYAIVLLPNDPSIRRWMAASKAEREELGEDIVEITNLLCLVEEEKEGAFVEIVGDSRWVRLLLQPATAEGGMLAEVRDAIIWPGECVEPRCNYKSYGFVKIRKEDVSEVNAATLDGLSDLALHYN